MLIARPGGFKTKLKIMRTRLIKFRGKDDSGKWLYGSYIQQDSVIVLDEGGEVAVNPDTVGQLIGIIPNTSMYVDNSQELYEGDLFTCGSSRTIYQAVYDGCGEYYGISNKGDEYGPYTIRLSRENVSRQNIEIVGNVVDNPELLKGGKE